MTDLLGDGEGLGNVKDAVQWVLEHREELVDLAQSLPKVLGEVGDALGAAGASATSAAGLLTGEDGSSVRDLATSAADAIEHSTDELTSITKVLSTIGDKLDAVPLIDDMASNVTDGVERVERIAADLAEVAKQLRGVGDQVTDAGKDLAVVGDKLSQGGETLVAFHATKKPSTTRSRAKTAPKAAHQLEKD